MKGAEAFERNAYANAIGSVRIDARLPQNVFVGTWDAFLFFEVSLLFEEPSVGILHSILDVEGSHSICLVNLGNVENYDPPPARYLDRSIDTAGYISLLRWNGGPDAWLYLVDRYICASDEGAWCIYGEKEEDIGILAIRREHYVKKLSGVTEKLCAKPIEALGRASKNGELKFELFTPVWRSVLREHYAK
jgi:hypothetical protein